jgi:exosome complex component RRP42
MKLNNEPIRRLAKIGKRIDGRGLTEFRGPIKIETNISKTAEGSAKVTIGETVVIAGVKLSIEKPYNDTPGEGGIMINAELTPLSSPQYEPGPPRIKAIELARVTDRGIRESKAIDVKKLCIKEGEKAWFVIIDIVTLNDAGNLFDAASFATMAALKNARFREFDSETGVVDYKKFTDEKLPLNKEPIAVTVWKINGALIVDPISEEENCVDARLTIASDSNGVISAMQKGGETTFTADEVSQIVDIAQEKSNFLREVLDNANL